jgi:hypothetical protein
MENLLLNLSSNYYYTKPILLYLFHRVGRKVKLDSSHIVFTKNLTYHSLSIPYFITVGVVQFKQCSMPVFWTLF